MWGLGVQYLLEVLDVNRGVYHTVGICIGDVYLYIVRGGGLSRYVQVVPPGCTPAQYIPFSFLFFFSLFSFLLPFTFIGQVYNQIRLNKIQLYIIPQ